MNNNNTFTFSTFGDFTKEKGHLYGQIFRRFRLRRWTEQLSRESAKQAVTTTRSRLNSNIRQNWIGEFSFGTAQAAEQPDPGDVSSIFR